MKSISKQVVILTTLSLAFVLSFGKMVSGKKIVLGTLVATSCCRDGMIVGYSNDCAEGTGNCKDGHCPQGESETQGICPQ